MSDHLQAIDSIFKNTAEERRKLREANPPVCDNAYAANAYFDWYWDGCGCGQLRFGYNPDTNEWWADTEMMGPESTRKLLHAFADFVADKLAPSIEAERKQWEEQKKTIIGLTPDPT